MPYCRPPTAPPTQLILASTIEAPAAARAYTREVIEYAVADPDPEYLFTVSLVVSELVTNAVRYGTEPGDSMLVVLDADDRRTRVEVHDTVRREPRLKPESDERGRGRGLYIVDALATWGTGERPMGKYVWAEVRRQVTTSPIKVTPSLAFLADVTFTTGMHYSDAGPVAQLLLIHAPPRRTGETFEWIEAGMRALSFCLGLSPIEDEPRYIGSRISLHHGVARLDYGDGWWELHIPGTGQTWQKHVAAGGPIRLALSFEPAPTGRTQDDLPQFIEAGIEAGKVRWGTTRARPRSRLNVRADRPGV
ncbi:ATP-binding protein [Streptomyces mobaraensis]|uniref:ATP-binding protein n=1 Tax=Streptomyces mobaraensis TaxID=35621 RepID=UPI003330539A